MKTRLLMILPALAAAISGIGQELTGIVTCPAARSINVNCLSNDALHPMPGSPYTYSITVPTVAGEKAYKWIVTQEQSFLSAGILNTANSESAGGLHIAAAGAELNSQTATGTGEDIELTWKSFRHDPAKPVFVVIYVENTDGCTTQNLKIFQIEPQQAFTLDIANLRVDGTVSAFGEPLESCVSNIVSAVYDQAATEGIIYDYGTDYLFYVITAAGFNGSWQPDFQLTGLAGTESATTEWAYADTPGTWNAAATSVNVRSASGSADASGECIIVRVSLKHNSEEGLAARNISLAVDGKSNSLEDINHTDCTADGFTNDVAVHVLKARPAVVKL